MILDFTPTQKRIYNLLADGLPHKREEIQDTFTDGVDSTRNIDNHLVAMRKKLRPLGYDVICQFVKRSNHFRLIRLVQHGDILLERYPIG